MLQLTVDWVNHLGYKALLSNCSRRTASQIQGDTEIFCHKKHMRDAIALVYTGGGYLGEGPATSAMWHAQLLRENIPICLAFRVAGKPYGLIGAGVGPLKYRVSRCAVGWLANGAVVNAVRDLESRQHLVAFGGPESRTVVTADMALSGDVLQLYPPNPDSKDQVAPYGVLHFTHKPDADRQQSAVCNLIRDFIARTPNARIIAISDNPTQVHARASESVVSFLGPKSSSVQTYESPKQICELLGNARFVISNKLHVSVVATAYGCPTFGLADHPKTERFFRHVGRCEYWSPRIKPNIEGLAKFLDDAWAGQVQPAPGLVDARSAADANRLYLEQIVNAG